MKRHYLFAAALALPQLALATTISGTLITAGGGDSSYVTVRAANGTEVTAWCVKKECEQVVGESDDPNQGYFLKKKFKGSKVILEYKIERNRGRVLGPGNDDRLEIVKQLTVLK